MAHALRYRSCCWWCKETTLRHMHQNDPYRCHGCNMWVHVDWYNSLTSQSFRGERTYRSTLVNMKMSTWDVASLVLRRQRGGGWCLAYCDRTMLRNLVATWHARIVMVQVSSLNRYYDSPRSQSWLNSLRTPLGPHLGGDAPEGRVYALKRPQLQNREMQLRSCK